MVAVDVVGSEWEGGEGKGRGKRAAAAAVEQLGAGGMPPHVVLRCA